MNKNFYGLGKCVRSGIVKLQANSQWRRSGWLDREPAPEWKSRFEERKVSLFREAV